MSEYLSITPIPNLFIDDNLQLGDFEVITHLSKEELEGNYHIDFTILNYLEKNVWVSSPIYVRKFSLNGSNDTLDGAFNAASKHVNHFINALVLFQPSITYIDRGPLWIFPLPQVTNGDSGKGDFPGIIEVQGSENLTLDSSFILVSNGHLYHQISSFILIK